MLSPSKETLSFSVANLYALFKSKFPCGLSDQTSLSLLVAAWISILTLIGKSNDTLDQSQPPTLTSSFTFRFISSKMRGPWTEFLNGSRLDHLSCQKLRLLSLPRVHLAPHWKVFIPFLMPFHTSKQGSFLLFLELSLWWVQYFLLNTWNQGASCSEWNLQFNLARRASCSGIDLILNIEGRNWHN